MIPNNIISYYRLHSKFYDLTRWAFLFGRYKIHEFLPDLPASARILDLGCGTGIHIPALRMKYPLSEIIGLDLSSDMLIKVADTSVLLKNEEYEASSFEPNSLDLIICSYSLSMMPESEEKIDSISHHLKKSGMLLVVDFDSTPFNWFSKWMKKNHVHFENKLFKQLENQFEIEYSKVKKAYFGLYTYTIYIGKNW